MSIQKFVGEPYVSWLPEDAIAAGVDRADVGAAIKSAAHTKVAQFADTYRARLATVSSGKLAEYRIKEEIARSPNAASADELALIEREAAAVGLDGAGLIDLITNRATAYRRIALLIGALEAEAHAAITIIPDDAADIESLIDTALTAVKQQAAQAFDEALALINGGA